MLRPPIIVVLGHVDHGKTTLLDRLRKSSVAAGEAGGITQSIGAFKVGNLTFIDTPGHEAFSKMRSRGADIADIALLVVAADDGVKPQTLESISIIKSAGIPFIVCINKIDLADAGAENVKEELGKHDCAVEGFGGTAPVVEISAKTGKNLEELLEMINLVWELHSSAQDSGSLLPLEAPIVDSHLDSRAGPVAGVIVRQGSLRVGDQITADSIGGNVKSLTDDRGRRIKLAAAGDPVQVLGLKSVPPVGSVLTHANSQQSTVNSQQLSHLSSIVHSPSSINVILKADSAATLETLEDIIIPQAEPKYAVVSAGVGDVTESDILLASSSKANIIGFKVNISKKRQKLAQNEGVVIINDNIIYRLLEKLTKLQEPKEEKLPPEKGRAKIVKIFTVNGVEIAGCKVESGRIEAGDSVFLAKDETRFGPAKIRQLKFRAAEIKQAKAGDECGVLLESDQAGKKLKLSEGWDIISYQSS